VVEVTVAGQIDPETGMVANLKDVDRVLRREFIDAVDHKHLNRDVDFLSGVVPTAENIAVAAFARLAPHFEPARLVRLRVTESENNSAEVTGE
jgi:6-pyruvoyltetrahydropterin/6-carboxytetrahydropterin synthase